MKQPLPESPNYVSGERCSRYQQRSPQQSLHQLWHLHHSIQADGAFLCNFLQGRVILSGGNGHFAPLDEAALGVNCENGSSAYVTFALKSP